MGTIDRYLRFIFTPFFRWWWALVTGVASLLSFVLTPATGWRVGSITMLLIVLACCTLLFLTLSVLVQGWPLYRDRYIAPVIKSIPRSKEFGGEWVLVLQGHLPIPQGVVLDVQRRLGDIQVPFALLEVHSITVNGEYIAKPMWLSPAHISDFAGGRFSVSDLVVTSQLQASRIREVPREVT